VTKTLLFVATGQGNLGGGQNRAVAGKPASPALLPEPAAIHVYDKTSGALVFSLLTPTRPLAAPMTYLFGGKQYLVVAAGSGATAELIAYTLGS
jgi:glucose dehydrogenase